MNRVKELHESIRFTAAIDQIKLQGCAYEHDILQLYNVGIPMYDLLEKHTGKSRTQLKQEVIPENDIIEAIKKSGMFALDLI